MSDITTVWDAQNSTGGWSLNGSSLGSGNDLSTAILISLFTDRLAYSSDDVTDGDRRGWWADSQSNLIGSRLWLLNRVKGPMNVPQLAKGYAVEALQWLLDDGIVTSFDISTSWVSPGRLDMGITAKKPNGTTQVVKLANLWNS